MKIILIILTVFWNPLIKGFQKTVVDRTSIIKKVIFCGDDPIYNEVINDIDNNGTREITMIRNTHESKMNVENIQYFFVSYLVGKSLGLKKGEL